MSKLKLRRNSLFIIGKQNLGLQEFELQHKTISAKGMAWRYDICPAWIFEWSGTSCCTRKENKKCESRLSL